MAKQEKKEVLVIDFEKFSIQQLPELQGKKEEIKGIIDANPVVEIVDNASYELAKKSRTAVKTLRTGLQREQKEVNSRIKKNVLEVIANEYDSLIGEVLEKESERQDPITIYEAKKEEEKREKERLEQERIDGIKNSIKEFGDVWEKAFSLIKFENIEECQKTFKESVSVVNASEFREYEVLFTDKVSYLTNLLESTISTLTEKEDIRIAQLEIEKEKERQRVDAEKIAEAQRLEREKFEKEQKAAAEKQRIAQEKFEQEKREFEEKKKEAKYQERIKMLADAGCTYFEETNCFQKNGFFYNCDDIRNSSDELFERELQDAKNPIVVGRMFTEEPQEVVFEEQPIEYVDPKDSLPLGTTDKIEEIANNDAFVSNYHEADVDPKGIIVNNEENLSENIVFESLDLTWAEIYSEWSINKTDCSFIEYLEQNFMVPERKQ